MRRPTLLRRVSGAAPVAPASDTDEGIALITVLGTMVGGRWVYRAAPDAP